MNQPMEDLRAQLSSTAPIPTGRVDYFWHAVFTLPQNEKSTLKHLGVREIEAFCPTYETVRVWKNRQRSKLTLPLFPSYLFVRICPRQWRDVLGSPGVLQIVGGRGEHSTIAEEEIHWLQSRVCRQRIEPFRDLVVGEKVRVKSGVLQGLEGTLVKKGDSKRFVLTLALINQHAAIQVSADDLEPIPAEPPRERQNDSPGYGICTRQRRWR